MFLADVNGTIRQLNGCPDVLANRSAQAGGKGNGTGNEQTASGGASQDSAAPPSRRPRRPALTFVATENRDSSGSPAVVGGAARSTVAGVGDYTNTFFRDSANGGGIFHPIAA